MQQQSFDGLTATYKKGASDAAAAAVQSHLKADLEKLRADPELASLDIP